MTGPALRVMLWNVHGGIGLDGRYDMERIAAWIRRAHPDIVALQEVGSHDRCADAEVAFKLLRQRIGNSVEARTISSADGQYGQLVASRWPIDEVAVHDISIPGREPRRAIDCVVRPFGTRLRIVATHFGLHFRERRHQMGRLAEILGDVSPLPTLVMGDFNEWRVSGPISRLLRARLGGGHPHRTFPSWMPCFPLDRIWCYPASILRGSWVQHDAKIASDHLPVVADIDLAQARTCSSR